MHSRRTAGAVRALTIVATVAAVGLAACGDDDDDAGGYGNGGAEATNGAPESTTRDRSADNSVQNAAAARFIEAVNAGSTDRVMETLTDDAVVIDTGRRFADPDSIRDWVDSEVTGVDGRITVRNERGTDDGAVLTVDFESSGFSGTDLRYTFTTRGDRVANLTLG